MLGGPINAATLTLAPGIPGGPGAPCGPGGPCMQKIKPVMVRQDPPPPTKPSHLRAPAAYFPPSQISAYSMQLGLAFKSTEGSVRGYWPLEEILVSTAGGASVLREVLLKHDFLYNAPLLKIWQWLTFDPQNKLKSFSSIRDRPNMQPEQRPGPATSAGPLNSLTIWICCLLSQKSPSHTVDCVSTLSQALTSL